MTNNIFLLLALVGLIFLILMLLVGVIIWRRRSKAAPGKPAKAKKEAAVERQLEKFAGSGSEAEAAAEAPADQAPKPAPAPAKPGAAPLPISALNHPEQSYDKIRILIVDDNPGTRENVGRLLYFEKDMEVIGQAVNGRQGIDMAVSLKPHIVLMDINMPDMDGITATGEMSLKTPYSQVVIMSVQAEQHYMKQAMAAGARDFQPKPFTADELISCVRRVYQASLPLYRQFDAVNRANAQVAAAKPAGPDKPQSTNGGPVIAVYSPKGGIGVSTIAVNLAVALQRMHGDVAVIDGDFQFGDVSVHLNTRANRTINDAIHNNELDPELLAEVMMAHTSGVKLLLAPTQPELADAITPPMVAQTLKTLKKQFKAIVVDTTSHLTDRTLSILDNADCILIVASPELPAIKSTKLFLELAPQLELPKERLHVVMNRSTLPGGIPAAKIEKALNLTETFQIPDDPRMHTAINKGIAVVLQDSGAPSAKAIHYLARTLWEKIGAAEAAGPVRETV